MHFLSLSSSIMSKSLRSFAVANIASARFWYFHKPLYHSAYSSAKSRNFRNAFRCISSGNYWIVAEGVLDYLLHFCVLVIRGQGFPPSIPEKHPSPLLKSEHYSYAPQTFPRRASSLFLQEFRLLQTRTASCPCIT